MLVIEGVSKSFGGVRALDSVQMRLPSGNVIGIVGPNGAGKTTLFNVISGVCTPDAGAVWYGDTRLNGTSIRRISQLGVTRTFQIPRVFSNLPVIVNVLLGKAASDNMLAARSFLSSHARGWSDKTSVTAASTILQDFGIGDKTQDLAGELSFGEQKLLEIARACFSDPTVLLLDEPSTGLNQQRQEIVLARIHACRRDHTLVAIIEHNIPFLLRCADTVFVLRQGRVHKQLRSQETNENELRELLGSW